jgi:hypothetical protein
MSRTGRMWVEKKKQKTRGPSSHWYYIEGFLQEKPNRMNTICTQKSSRSFCLVLFTTTTEIELVIVKINKLEEI